MVIAQLKLPQTHAGTGRGGSGRPREVITDFRTVLRTQIEVRPSGTLCPWYGRRFPLRLAMNRKGTLVRRGLLDPLAMALLILRGPKDQITIRIQCMVSGLPLSLALEPGCRILVLIRASGVPNTNLRST